MITCDEDQSPAQSDDDDDDDADDDDNDDVDDVNDDDEDADDDGVVQGGDGDDENLTSFWNAVWKRKRVGREHKNPSGIPMKFEQYLDYL